MIKELMDKFRIKHHNFTLYYLQINGQVERFNKILKESLVKKLSIITLHFIICKLTDKLKGLIKP